MSTITVDRAFKEVLSGVTDVTQLRDPDGNLLGTFTPQQKVDEMLVRKLFDLEKVPEILAREGGKGRPLKEILAELAAREQK